MNNPVIAAALGAAIALLAPAAGRAEAIKIGIGPVTSTGPIFIAQDKGYFAGESLAAETVSFDAAQSVAQGVVAGDLDIGATAASAAFYNLAAKGGLVIIGGESREAPGYHGAAFLASNHAWDAGLKSLKDLTGHTIGIVQVGGPIHYEVELAADKYHVDVKSLRLVALQGLSNVASALAGGQVDAGIEVNTIALRLLNTNKAHLLGWVGDETPWQNALLFVATKTANERKPMVEAFLRAYRKGAHDYHDAFTGPDGKRKDEATAPAVLAILAKHLNQPVDQLAQGISYDDPDARLDVQDVLRQVDWFKKHNMLPADADGAAMIDQRYVLPYVGG
jgi:NitT/TauT family transport system substrate-binding protein